MLIASSIGGVGHLNPLLSFLKDGEYPPDQVLVVVPPELEGHVAASGLPYEVGGAPPQQEVAAIRSLLPALDPVKASELVERELFGRLATGAMLPTLERVVEAWHPHLVLREPCEYASAAVATRAGIPFATVAISVADGEARCLNLAEPVLEPYASGLAAQIRRSPYLTRFPPSIDPEVFPVTLRYREPTTDAQSLPDWWPGREGPLVYMTFGTVFGQLELAGDGYRRALEAAAELSARVLLTVGPGTDPASLPAPPPNVRLERYVPQQDVLDAASLVITHGGSGTCLGALAAGVPLVVVPFFADQFENGRRLARAGAALVAAPEVRGAVSANDSQRIVGAARAVLGDPAYRRAAAALSAEIRDSPCVDELLQDRLLVVASAAIGNDEVHSDE
ncbi:MAG: glycosyltransferase, family [Acidimicrobiaceae bacterium]|nr:glycosyltransferase, family [Acidimicrobiaceae bacterium]